MVLLQFCLAVLLSIGLAPQGCAAAELQGTPNIQQLENEGPLDSGGRRSCMELFVLYTQATSCRTILPAPDRNQSHISTELCFVHGDGMLINVYMPMHSQHSTVFHALLQGPQIMVPHFTACSMVQRNDTGPAGEQRSNPVGVHRSFVPNLLPGNYSFTLRLVAENFTFGTHKEVPLNHDGPLMRTFVLLDAPNAPRPASSYANAGAWPVCQRSFLHGTILSNLTATQSLAKGYGRDYTWQGHLRWQPQGCNLVPLSKIDVPACIKDKLVCFIGDSHMRFMQNGLVVSALGHSPPVDPAKGPKTVLEHTNTRYIREDFLNASNFDRQALSGCTHLFMNAASWPLSKEVPARWTAGHYAQHLAAAFRWLSDNLPGTRVHWVTSAAHSWLRGTHDCRYPPYMEAFNHVGVISARMLGLPVINTWDITEPLYEASSDLLHHEHTGIGGYFINEYLLNVLCVQT